MKSLLKDKKVLYIVMFVSVVNFFVYLLMHNWTASLIFILIGYLTTYFSKNMIVVLLTTLVSTNLIVASRVLGKRIEGVDETLKEEGPAVPPTIAPTVPPTPKPEGFSREKPSQKDGYTNKNDINYAATLENAYDSLDGLIGEKGIDKMSMDTQRLVEQQNKLLKNLENMAPLLENATKLLDSMPIDGINKIQDSLGGLMGNLKNFSGK